MSKVFRMSGKVCVVFGGSSGIGKSICKLFASRGARVVVIGRNAKKASQTLETLPKIEKQLHASYVCDVTDPSLVQQTISQIQSEIGSISILVNSAGINKDSLLMRSKITDIENIIKTNLLGSVYTCRAALKSMIQRREGSIVNIGSIVGVEGNVGQSIYSASKSGLVGFTKSLAKEVASKGICVNLLAPGLISTEMTANTSTSYKDLIPMGRFGDTSEVADAVLFLVQSPFITGQVLLIDGGLHLKM